MIHTKRASALSMIFVMVLILAACPAKDAAVAVNRYATALSSIQDAEIAAYQSNAVDNRTHGQIQMAIKQASKAGRDLNTAIKVASSGGDPQGYVDAALRSYDDLVTALRPSNNQSLIAAGNAAGALVKNAISLIQQLKAQKGGK